MDWYFHSQFSIDSGWHLLTKLRNTLVMRSFCAPFVSPPISLVWKVSEYLTLLQLLMGMSWGFNDGVQLHQRLATVMGCNVHPIPSHHSLCVSSISITPGHYRARRGNQGKSCPSGGYLLSRLEMLEDPFGQCFTVLPVLLLLLYYFFVGGAGEEEIHCFLLLVQVRKG